MIVSVEYPEIIRATAVNRLSEQIYSKDDVNMMLDLLQDSSVMVRREAAISVANFNFDVSTQLKVLLDDPYRVVRIAAVRYFILNNIGWK